MGDVVLGIETSCDETAVAVVERASVVRSSVVSSQIEQHARFGGVVPEIAGRAHVQELVPVLAEALATAGVEGPDVEVVAATTGPGLVGSLLVGVSAAKALSLVWGVPFVSVNHLEAHLYASFLEEPDLELPLVVLLVSGGHTMLVLMEDHGRYRLLGSTLDDAAGEAFDKVARYLGLGYPGGPAIDSLAAGGDGSAFDFPRSMVQENPDTLPDDRRYAFSFSGLKTAVVN
ncbi:MAG: tRNA (adenosine(37)-N6)-threonylcarbamoyltransferase complex transferase subunit TsaD, partial [Actinomycetota bacterium]|nr:tRNA (adenosine(37)-N6)-threonylcarbamoyltransferase complex transferase subunit TsaD [Actinomycetota bacterium]